MFDVIPRWALALGIGTISAAGVGTLAFEAIGSSPACVETHSSILDSNSCAKGDAAQSALVNLNSL
jgi:hypothetical protein